MNEINVFDVPEAGRKRFIDRSPDLYVIDEDGHRIGVTTVIISVTYRTITTLVPFDFREYFDRAKDSKLYRGEFHVSRVRALGSPSW
jgi:hypothetical protein